MPASPSLARWISILAHPFVMAVVMAVTTGIRFGALRGGMGAAVAVGLVILPVALLMWAGAWSPFSPRWHGRASNYRVTGP